MSVTIRRLKPTVHIAMPTRPRTAPATQRWNAARTRVVRRRADFPPPTPQPTPCVLWQGSVTKDGYGRRKVDRRGKRVTYEVHRWVMEQVLERPLRSNEVVLHHCDNPPCFRVDHLSVGTVQDNNADMRAKGRNVPPPINVYRGECHPMAKLTAAQVRKIRGMWQSGLTMKTIAEDFDVSRQTIGKVVHGISWRHEPPPFGASVESGRLPPKRNTRVKPTVI